jgi:peptide/nickel transport system permease protein
MTDVRYVLARLGWTVFAAWLVLSASFLLFAYTPDPNESLVAFGAGGGEAGAEAVEAYREARNYDQPILDRYLGWMGSYATLDWGYSYTYGKPVIDVVAAKSVVTLSYLLPAVLLSLLVGTLLGVVSAAREGGPLDVVGRSLSYLGLGTPNFWLANFLVLIGISYLDVFTLSNYGGEAGLYSAENLPLVVVAGVTVGVHLLAVQARYTRSEVREYLPQDFVKTLRSTGASGVSVVRHVLRNASIPLVSLLFTEVLVVLMIDVFVIESVLDVPGLGLAARRAIDRRDVGLILGTWILPMLVALLGGLLQDTLYATLDPRVGSD